MLCLVVSFVELFLLFVLMSLILCLAWWYFDFIPVVSHVGLLILMTNVSFWGGPCQILYFRFCVLRV